MRYNLIQICEDAKVQVGYQMFTLEESYIFNSDIYTSEFPYCVDQLFRPPSWLEWLRKYKDAEMLLFACSGK